MKKKIERQSNDKSKNTYERTFKTQADWMVQYTIRQKTLGYIFKAILHSLKKEYNKNTYFSLMKSAQRQKKVQS